MPGQEGEDAGAAVYAGVTGPDSPLILPANALQQIVVPGTNYAKIKVIGVGGAGCNALYRMLSTNGNTQSNIVYVAMNTDVQHLDLFGEEKLKEKMKNYIVKLDGDEGLGAGGIPQEGEKIMTKAIAEKKLENIIDGKEDLILVTAGLGGGTGTGSLGPLFQYIVEKAPNAVPVFIGTWPYDFEGDERKSNADYGYNKLTAMSQVKILTIENNALLSMAKAEYAKTQEVQQQGKRKRKGIPAEVAFGYSDMVLVDGISVVKDLITIRTKVNLDMKDAKTIMSAGTTIRFGRALSDESEDRAKNALDSILANPIYRNPINGASACLISFYGDVDIEEINDVVGEIKTLAKPGANIIFGGIGGKTFDKEVIEIALIATGFEDAVRVGAGKREAAGEETQDTSADTSFDEDAGGVFTGFAETTNNDK